MSALGAAIILLYTISGGYTAVVINDAIGAVLILGSLVLLPLIAVLRYPGSILETLATLSPNMVDPFALSAGAAIGVYAVVDDGSPPNPWHECRQDNNTSAPADPASCIPG